MDLESSYGRVKTGGLKLKGEKKKKKKKSKKREHSGEREQAESGQDDAKVLIITLFIMLFSPAPFIHTIVII